jgi:coenzyme F420 hydrogenase subunit beta
MNPIPEPIVEPSLCTRCGCCAAVCPQECISIDSRTSAVRGEGCIHCGLCEQVCPGEGMDLHAWGRLLFKRIRYFEGSGWVRNAYTAYATEENTRKAGTSGGVVTTLLEHLLDSKIIDGALVVTFDADHPWTTRYIVATSKEEVARSAQTKYQITSLEESLHQIPQERLAVVGLPCMIQGMRRLQKTAVGKKIVILLGLFCWVHMEEEATTCLLRKLHCKKQEVETIEYRSGDYLGGFRVTDIHGNGAFLEKECYNLLPLLYAPERCTVCADFTNELADISFGDAKSVQSERGHTFVLTRSELGQQVFNDCQRKGLIAVTPCSVDEIRDSEISALLFKKGALKRIEKRGLPIFYGTESYEIPLKHKLYEFIFFFIHARRNFFRKIIEIMPLSHFKIISKWITRKRSQ